MNGLCGWDMTGQSKSQLAARAEWRTLCFVLEGLQATLLLASGCDKYALARTYVVYRDDYRATADAVARAIDSGDFHFFAERGVTSAIINSTLARQMLRDWSAAVASKQARIEDLFSCHFGEELDEFILTPEHAPRIRAAASRDEVNAMTLLERWLTGPEELVGAGI